MKFFLDLNNRICIALVKDDYLVFYKEFDYSPDVLDQLYCELIAYSPIEEFIVVCHGTLSEKVLPGSIVSARLQPIRTRGSLFLLQSASDCNSLIHLAKVVGISNIRFVERMGYYTSLPMDGCYTAYVAGVCEVFGVKDNSIVGYNLATLSSLDNMLKVACTNIGVPVCQNADTIIDTERMMNSFQNIHSVTDHHALFELTLFAYAASEDSNAFTIDATLAEKGSALGVKKSALLDNEGDNREIQMEEQVSVVKKSALNPSKHKNTGESLVNKVCVALAMLLTLATCVGYGGKQVLTSKIEKRLAEVNELTAQVNDLSSQVEAGSQFLEAGTFNPAVAKLSELGFHASEMSVNVLDEMINGDNILLTMQFTNKDVLKKSVELLQTSFSSVQVQDYYTGDALLIDDIIFVDAKVEGTDNSEETGTQPVADTEAEFVDPPSLYILNISL